MLGSPRPLAVAVRHAELCEWGTVTVNSYHPCHYGKSWSAASGCPTGSLPRPGLNREPLSPPWEGHMLRGGGCHTITFSQCPSSLIVMDCSLLPMTGVATPWPTR